MISAIISQLVALAGALQDIVTLTPQAIAAIQQLSTFLQGSTSP